MLPLAFASVAAGVLLLVAGMTGSSLASVLHGSPDGANATTPSGAGAAGSSTTAPSPGASSSTSKGTGGASSGSLPAAALTRLRQIAAAHHWSVADWLGVIALESGGNPNAVNPESGAYGIGQALGATQQEYPKMVSHNPVEQVEGMAEYIAARYGNPTKALEHEHSHHWY